MKTLNRIMAVALILLLLNMDAAIASKCAAEMNNTGDENEIEIHLQAVPDPDPAGADPGPSKITSFVCRVGSSYPETRLSEKEANNLLQLSKDGFEGQEMSSGTPPNPDRESLLKDDVLLTDPDEEIALKSKVPARKIDPSEIAHILNNHVSGAWGIGLVLDDTLRTARCEHGKDLTCSVMGTSLELRNEGTAFQTSKQNLKALLPDFMTGETGIPGIGTDDADVIRGYVLTEENEDVQVEGYDRLRQTPISNSILTRSFEASLQTNCATGACKITTYSLFDKLFNNWLSMDMVAAEAAPTLIYRSRRMFTWFGQKGFPSYMPGQGVLEKVRQTLYNPNSMYGKIVLNRLRERFVKTGNLTLLNQLVTDEGGYSLLKSGGFEAWLGKALAPDGHLGKITDFKARGEIFKSIKDMRSYARAAEITQEKSKAKFSDILKQQTDIDPRNLAVHAGGRGARNHPDVVAAKLEYAQEVARNFDVYDDVLNFDVPDWFAKHPQAGFYDLGVYDETTQRVASYYIDSKPIKHTMRKFSDDGHWANMGNDPNRYRGAVYQTVDGGPNLQLYKVKLVGSAKPELVGFKDLEANITNLRESFVRLDNGDIIQLDKATLPFIKDHTTGAIEVFSAADAQWVKHKALTPNDFAEHMLNPRVQSATTNFKYNTEKLYKDLSSRNWGDPRFTSLLNKAMMQEEELIKKYFSIKGAAKWTVAPYVYWYAKRGFNIEEMSAYQLPDTWHDLAFTLDEEAIYDDAYVDFFANGGSDQGDIFLRIINNLPWKFVINKAAENFLPANSMYDFLLDPDVRRDEVENIAFYASTANDDCPRCSIVLKGENLRRFTPAFSSSERVDAYILEDTESKEAVEKGQTLIAFAHHTDLEGRTRDIDLKGEGEGIDLGEAIKEEETCSDKLKELTLGYDLFDSPESAAAILGATEAVAYLAFGWSGVFASAALQFALIPEIQDCVDTHEGYYVHYFVPVKEEQEEETNETQLSTTQVNEFIKSSQQSVQEAFAGVSGSSTDTALQGISDQFERLVNTAEDSGIVQANLILTGQANGKMDGLKLFYLWAQPGSELTTAYYVQDGKKVWKDKHSDTTFERDYKTGEIKVDGKVIVDNPDLTRNGVTSTVVPGELVPQRVGLMSVPSVHDILIEVDVQGNSFVRDSLALDCIQRSVEDQTGVALNSDNLREAFGKVDVVVTDSHPAVRPLINEIIADGNPRKAAIGKNSKIHIFKDQQVEIIESTDGDNKVGNLRSIQFANGSILINPNTGEMIIWLRHHEKAVLHQEDIGDLKASLTSSFNPETGCEEPAIDLRVIASHDTPLANSKVEAFNQSLGTMGPFQIFDTVERRYILYQDEECVDHFKVMDKNTGEVKDYKGQFIQTPDGIKFIDESGKEHTLDFSTENGVPTVSYNGGNPETLRSAQGRNGSFYYDPDKGLWYAENAQLLPLIEAFKEMGINTKANPDGSVTTTAAGNVLNLDLSGSRAPSLFDLPSMPENSVALFIFIIAILFTFIFARVIIEKKRRIN